MSKIIQEVKLRCLRDLLIHHNTTKWLPTVIKKTNQQKAKNKFNQSIKKNFFKFFLSVQEERSDTAHLYPSAWRHDISNTDTPTLTSGSFQGRVLGRHASTSGENSTSSICWSSKMAVISFSITPASPRLRITSLTTTHARMNIHTNARYLHTYAYFNHTAIALIALGT